MEEDFKQTHRGEADVKMEAEIRVMQPQAKERQQPPEAGRGREWGSPLLPMENVWQW